jgi:CRISPR-associated endonuclease/helicase Cas3
VNLTDYIKEPNRFHAHIKRGIKAETLEEHSLLTLKYFKDIVRQKNLDSSLDNLGKEFLKSTEAFSLWKEMLYSVMSLHDLGKVNINYQSKKLLNPLFKLNTGRTTWHSNISSKYYYDIYYSKIEALDFLTVEDEVALKIFLSINSFILSKHHGKLDNFEVFMSSLGDFADNFTKDYGGLCDAIINVDNRATTFNYENRAKRVLSALSRIEEKENWKSLSLYVYTKLVFSLLVSSDFYATHEYMSGKEVNEIGLIKDSTLYEGFKLSKTYKSIKEYSSRRTGEFNNINEVRSELFLEAESNLRNNLDNNLFYLEAPTGVGKSNTAINLSLTLVDACKDVNKIFYVFPFNTLVEQTKDVLLECFKGSGIDLSEHMSVMNSITPIKEIIKDEDTEEVDYNKSLLSSQFLHFPIVLTTHVKLFSWLFGVSREANFALAQLANSVIVLDEIQSYKPSIWIEIVHFLCAYAKLLNIKVIIMSATLPKLGALADNESSFVALVNNRDKYFQCKYFKDRVKCDFSLLSLLKDRSKEEIFKTIAVKAYSEYFENKKVVIEFISKKTAVAFFKFLGDMYSGSNICLITGDDSLADRKEIVDSIKYTDNAVILVATQVIEAGVDIDMDTGFKDCSKIDSEEQFMGRINRSCKKEGCVLYLFNLDNASGIYRGDKRTHISVIDKENRCYLVNKDFPSYYSKVFTKLIREANVPNAKSLDNFRKDSVSHLKFFEISERLKLIEEREDFPVFLNRDITVKGEVLSGSQVWSEYKELLNNNVLTYAEKRVKLSRATTRVNYFIYKVYKDGFSYQEKIGDISYIENGIEYFIRQTDGKMKFDRSKFDI